MSGTLLRLSPSPRLAALIVVIHFAAGAAAWAALGGAAGAGLATGLAALGLAAAWDRALLRSARAARALELGADGAVALELADGSRVDGRAAKRRYVTRFAVVLTLGRPARRAVLVAADMLDPGRFRVLRLWALWGRLPEASGPRGVAGAQLEG